MTASVMSERAAAVASAVEQIKRLEAGGVTRETLERVKAVVIDLASRTELFPPEHFPVPAGSHGAIYRLSEERDRRFALYASAGIAGKAQPPHNHTTWAIISGIYGDEKRGDDLNIFCSPLYPPAFLRCASGFPDRIAVDAAIGIRHHFLKSRNVSRVSG